jgi:crotonobetainyl-CoA:carnitine CoA-transferase CaiB-like acyl-CoA transferase
LILHDIRVVEVSHAVAGPTAAQVLADYGAEVIKIERPESGDIFRNVPGMGPTMFLAVNRGKRSAAIDLKSREGLRIFYDLVRKSDVVIENLGPGIAEGLGISYAKIKRSNSKSVYCKIESFGKGPYENTPAFDPILQAAVGIMSTTGFPPDHYVRAGVSMVDMSTGLQAASGILALLLKRTKTGRGAQLKISLYDAASYYMSYWVAMYDLFQKDTTPLGSGHIFGSPYNLFRTKDGFLYIAIASDAHWQSFCSSLGFSDLLKKKSFEKTVNRVRLKGQLEKIVASRLRKLPTEQVESRLRRSGVPFGRFNTVRSLLQDPHLLGREILKGYSYLGKDFRTIVNPALVDEERPYAKGDPPELGEDTDNVLRSVLGKTKTELKSLRSKHVIA